MGSSVFQVFDGGGSVTVGEHTWQVQRGDLFVVPSWQPFSAQASTDGALDLFRFSDSPIFEALHAPLHGGGRQVHGLCNHALGRGVVGLQDVEDGKVKAVKCSGGGHARPLE